MREFAVYVAHQEAEVERQAIVYNPDDTKQYWGLHTNGKFIKHAARDAAVSMAIHDEVFFKIFEEWELTLTSEEQQILDNDVYDLWCDLTEDEKVERLGITEEDCYNAMYKIACAQKAQMLYASMENLPEEEFDFSSEHFLELLEAYEYKVEDSILKRLDFGNITIVR